jgi:peptidoglycan/LPS O-acetylase OafA/YrhL
VIGDMALGGFFAYLTSYPNKFLTYITNLSRIKIIAIYVIAAGLFLLRRKLFYGGFPFSSVPERLIIAVFFGLIIIEQNFSKNSFYKFSRFKLMSRLGIYTYGLYCLHFMGIYTALAIVIAAGGNQFTVLTNLIMAVLALVVTVGLSLLSYHLFEKKFLTLKDRFAFITK